MTNEYILHIIESEYKRAIECNVDSSMSEGAMGIALFLIWYGTKHNSSQYITKGINLIETRCLNLSTADPLDFHKGQIGIGIGLLWLWHAQIFDTPISGILKELDDNIFRNLMLRLDKIENKHIGTLIDIATYIALRLHCKSYDEVDIRLYSKLLSKLINTIYPRFYNFINQETYPGGYSYNLPRFVYLIAMSFGNNFDNRLSRIIEEIQPRILAQIPYLVSNRLALANAIIILGKYKQLPEKWHAHKVLLMESVHPDDIKEEFRTNQMSLYNGLGWFAIQLLIQMKYFGYTNTKVLDCVRLKLETTEYNSMSYENIISHGFSGLYGILGFIYIRLSL